jgi:hypothetical protein
VRLEGLGKLKKKLSDLMLSKYFFYFRQCLDYYAVVIHLSGVECVLVMC